MTVTGAARPRIGFVGLGDMGGRIAERIAAAGYPLTVFDTRPEAVAELIRVGATAAAGVAEVGSASDVLCICVVDDDQVRAVLAQLTPRAGLVVMIHSSLLPATVRALGQDLGAAGVAVVDAPVSGSRPAAESGTLTALVGGDPGVVETVRPLLAGYCSNVIHAGALGSGSLLKIANNVLLHMNHLVAVEAARFARANGIEEKALIEAANVSTGRSWVTETWGLMDDMLFDHPLSGTEGIYSIMSKEMWHAVEIARAALVPLPLTALGTQLSKAYFQERSAVVTERD